MATSVVLMLSNVNATSKSSIQQFMKSNAHMHNVHSMLLQFFPLNADTCRVKHKLTVCNCIVFWAVEEMTIMLARRLPGTLKRLTDPMYLLPCRTCLINGCHECNQEQSDEGYRSRESGSSIVSDILDAIRAGLIHREEPICICIPMDDAPAINAVWTNLVVRTLKSKDAKVRDRDRAITRAALEGYLAGNRRDKDVTEYNNCSIVPRLIEVLINLVLTFGFGVDAFSSSVAARYTIIDLMKSEGRVWAANAYLTKATFNTDKHVCMTFKGNNLRAITLSLLVGGVNLICFICWAVLIWFKGSHSSLPLSIPRVAVIITAICIALVMDCLYFFRKKRDYKVLLMIILEITCIAAVSVVVKISDINAFGKWIFLTLQVLVWVKWGIGSYIVDNNFGDHSGILVCSSAFLLNAALTGVRSDWRPLRTIIYFHFMLLILILHCEFNSKWWFLEALEHRFSGFGVF